MTQYPGGQPPQDPYYGQPPSGDPYAPPPQQPSDPYFGQPAGEPYGQQPPPDWQQQQQAEAWAQWQAQQQASQAQQSDGEPRQRGGLGAAIVGVFLVLLGAWYLFADEIDLDFARVWPMVAVGLGIVMVIAAFIPRRSS